MRILFLIFMLLLVTDKVRAFSIAEIAVASTLPILYDQYFDNSLSEKNVFQKKKQVLKSFYKEKSRTIESPNIRSNSDLIYYLDIVDQLNIRAKYN